MAAPPTDDTPADDPRSPVTVEPLTDTAAGGVLAAVEARAAGPGASVVDEAELARLRRLAGTGERAPDWTPLLALAHGRTVGYGGLVVARTPQSPEVGSHGPAAADTGDGGPAVAAGDAAVTTDASDAVGVLRALLAALADTADVAGAERLQVWVRHVGRDEFDAAAAAGYRVDRRLAVLGRGLDDVEVVAPRGDWTIRASVRGDDDAAVVEVLAAAYAGTAEAGWGDPAQFAQRQRYAWYRPEDLLVAEGPDGRLGGLHWVKRRSDTQGEVYNLAIAPHAQGAGLGAALLTAGLAHLRDVGCDEVLLWVDRANERAVRLYEKVGFTTRWDDVAFAR